MELLVTGATGFIGQRLVGALVEAGHTVRAGTRRPDAYRGPGAPVHADLDRPRSVRAALDGCDAAYYLIHSLETPDFQRRDRELAGVFGRAAQDRVERLIYLGGLGRPDSRSPHLRSRHEVGAALAQHVPTVELRAGLVLGPGSASYELLRQIVRAITRGPGPRTVPAPRALRTRTQPIGLDDTVRYLVAALELAPGRYDIGAPEVLSYAQLMELQADVAGERLAVHPKLPVPPRAFAPLAALLTDQRGLTIHALLTSAADEVVVEDDRIVRLTGIEPTPLAEVLERATG